MINSEKITPLIIEGAPRSGTRFFCKFIEHQFSIIIFRLQRIFRKYYGSVKNYGDLRDDNALRSLLDDLRKEIIIKERIGEIDIDQFVKTLLERNFTSIIRKIIEDRVMERKLVYWGLKFDNPSGIALCDKLFPDCKFIHIIRDGRDVHLSACRTLSEGYHTPYNNAEFWKSMVEERRAYGASMGPGRYLEVKYEKLLLEPKQIANKISEFLNIDKFTYNEMDIKSSNFNKWKKIMSNNDLRVYEAVAGGLLKELCYETKHDVAVIRPIEVCYYNAIEKPMKLKKYAGEFLNPNTRNRVIRRFKLKLKDYF